MSYLTTLLLCHTGVTFHWNDAFRTHLLNLPAKIDKTTTRKSQNNNKKSYQKRAEISSNQTMANAVKRKTDVIPAEENDLLQIRPL